MSICDHRGPPCVDTQRRVQFVLIHKLKTRIMVLLETLRFQPLVAANWDDAVRKVFVLGWPNVSFRCLGNFGTTNQNRILYAFVPSLAPLQLPLPVVGLKRPKTRNGQFRDVRVKEFLKRPQRGYPDVSHIAPFIVWNRAARAQIRIDAVFCVLLIIFFVIIV
eukprot:GEMP01093596.1.p1 GENE.GEMP01093596.1~~GEMP01093596.1.p1  ORF type:complete len:163 (+),score=24.41 GEMP01093596.1:200-688(+)